MVFSCISGIKVISSSRVSYHRGLSTLQQPWPQDADILRRKINPEMYEQGGKETRVTALTVERENPKVTLKERRRPTGEKQKRVEADEKAHKP